MEKGDQSGIYENDEKSTKRMAARGPFRSISVDGDPRNYLYKIPYSCLRQNSVNNSEEYNDLKDRKGKDWVNTPKSQLELQNSVLGQSKATVKENNQKVSYVREISKVSVTENLLLKDNSDSDFKIKMSDVDLVEDGQKHKEPRYNVRGRGRGSCLWIMSGFSCLLSFVTIGLVLLVFTEMRGNSGNLRQDMAESMQMSHSGQSNSNIHISGNFKINQTHLQEYRKVVWLTDEFSEIIPSRSDDCLTVPYGGKYLVFSRFTFNLPPEVQTTIITHILKIKTSKGELKEGGFKRKYVSVVENKLRANIELREPSVFIEFFELEARDQICPNVSNPDLLYESKIDNDVNIIKV